MGSIRAWFEVVVGHRASFETGWCHGSSGSLSEEIGAIYGCKWEAMVVVKIPEVIRFLQLFLSVPKKFAYRKKSWVIIKSKLGP